MSAILECKSLTKNFSKLTALANVNLTLERGRIIGLLGPNGSGKTTLIKLINGLLVQSSGTLLIDGKEPGIETKKIISYLPEKTYLPEWMKVSETIEFFCDFYEDFDKKKAYEMMDRLHLDPTKRLKTLSKGTKEKIQLILVMSRKADLYCLDEPIGGVDPAARDYILNTIISNYNENATVLIPHILFQISSRY
jgi:ABC-2 type transport system ATP-binding protein